MALPFVGMLVSNILDIPKFNAVYGILLSFMIALYGIWCFTVAPSHSVLSPRTTIACYVAHWSCAIVAIGTILMGITGFMMPQQRLIVLLLLGVSPFGIVGGIGAIAFCYYCESVARLSRMPFERDRSGTYRRGFMCGWIVSCVVLGFVAANGMSGGAACVGLPAFCLELGFGALILSLPSGLVDRLQKVNRIAARVWTRYNREYEQPDLSSERPN